MTSPLNTWVAIQLVAGPDTPAEQVQYDQKIIGVPPEYQGGLTGVTQTNPRVLIGIRGYYQAGGPVGNQWVMTGLVTATMQTKFQAIPGPKGWASGPAQSSYVQVARLLLADPYDVPGTDVLNLLQTLYSAAVTNTTAQQAMAAKKKVTDNG